MGRESRRVPRCSWTVSASTAALQAPVHTGSTDSYVAMGRQRPYASVASRTFDHLGVAWLCQMYAT